jgi:hypothetical protein
MPLSARQQTRLNYLQKRRPNDPEVAKLQGKGVPQDVLPVARSEQPRIPNPQGVDPGRYPQMQEQIQSGANPNFSRPEDFVRPGTRLGQAFAQGAMEAGGVKQRGAQAPSGFKNNPYQVLRK